MADLSGYEEKAHAFAEECKALRAERDRYRAAWQNARERARDGIALFAHIRDSRALFRDQVERVREACDELDALAAEMRRKPRERTLAHAYAMSAARIRRALDGEGTDGR